MEKVCAASPSDALRGFGSKALIFQGVLPALHTAPAEIFPFWYHFHKRGSRAAPAPDL